MDISERNKDMQEISAQLRRARESSGLSLNAISSELCIRRAYLEAMENGRFDDLPPPAYTSGFLRSYARALGLDADALSAAYRTAIGDQAIRAELQFPEPIADSRMPGGGAIAAGLVGLTLIYVGWIHDFSGNSADISQQVADVPERLSVIANAMATPALDTAPSQKNVSAAKKTDTAGSSYTGQDNDTDRGLARQAQSAPDAAPAVAGIVSATLPEPQPASADVAPDSSRVTLTAEHDAWLYIVDSMNREVWAGVLREGESWSPDREGLTLMTGNAGGVLVSVGNRPARPLGEKGAVLRNLSLDAETLSGLQGG